MFVVLMVSTMRKVDLSDRYYQAAALLLGAMMTVRYIFLIVLVDYRWFLLLLLC